MPTNFYLNKTRTDKRGESQIRVSITMNGARLLTTAGVTANVEVWNKEAQCCRPKSHTNRGVSATEINGKLTDIRKHFDAIEASLGNEPITSSYLQAEFEKQFGRKREAATNTDKGEVIRNFDTFVLQESRANQWTDGTLECCAAFKQHLLRFGGESLKYSRFNEDGIKDFIHYLRVGRGMDEKTVQKHYSNLRWYLYWAIRKGYCKEQAIHNYKPRFKIISKPVIFLDKAELLKLYNYEIPANGTEVSLQDLDGKEYKKTVRDASALNKTRDLFCFCAFTSLRYSDMAKLKRSDIVNGTINVTTQKTNDSLTIELNNYSRAILDKYKDTDFPHGLALPVISNQKMNDYIKDLGELCGINEPVTKTTYRGGEKVTETAPKFSLLGTHAGRRTFICYALASGVPPQIVMKWTGHSDYKAMKPYIDIAQSDKAKAMNVFNTL